MSSSTFSYGKYCISKVPFVHWELTRFPDMQIYQIKPQSFKLSFKCESLKFHNIINRSWSGKETKTKKNKKLYWSQSQSASDCFQLQDINLVMWREQKWVSYSFVTSIQLCSSLFYLELEIQATPRAPISSASEQGTWSPSRAAR